MAHLLALFLLHYPIFPLFQRALLDCTASIIRSQVSWSLQHLDQLHPGAAGGSRRCIKVLILSILPFLSFLSASQMNPVASVILPPNGPLCASCFLATYTNTHTHTDVHMITVCAHTCKRLFG